MSTWHDLLAQAHQNAGSPTVRSIARDSGISHTTVARVLNGYPSRRNNMAEIIYAIDDDPDTRKAILDAFDKEEAKPLRDLRRPQPAITDTALNNLADAINNLADAIRNRNEL